MELLNEQAPITNQIRKKKNTSITITEELNIKDIKLDLEGTMIFLLLLGSKFRLTFRLDICLVNTITMKWNFFFMRERGWLIKKYERPFCTY